MKSLLSALASDHLPFNGQFASSIKNFSGLDTEDTATNWSSPLASGRDALVIDQRNAITDYPYANIRADNLSGFSGSVFANPTAGVNFVSIEDLAVMLAPDSGGAVIDASPLLSGATLALHGGGGQSRLEADFSKFTGLNFQLSGDGLIESSHGTFSGFNSFKLQLGAGLNTITTGAGNDWIEAGNGRNIISTGDGGDFVRSIGGIDTIDAGDNPSFGSVDQWSGDYTSITSNVEVGIAGNALSVSNGSLIKGFEYVSVNFGAGNDIISIGSTAIGNIEIGAGVGRDTLAVDQANISVSQNNNRIISTSEGGFNGSFFGQNRLSFIDVENVQYKGGSNETFLAVDAAAVGQGATLDLDGGKGSSTLDIDFSQLSNTRFIMTGRSIESNYGAFASWETISIKVGDGNNLIVTDRGNDQINASKGVNFINSGAGDDIIYTEGTAIVNGGDGNDIWSGLVNNPAGPASVRLFDDGAVIDNGSFISATESIIVQAGDNGVSFSTNANAKTSWFFLGGAGLDSLVADHSGLRDGGMLTSIQSTGIGTGGFSTQLYNAGFTNRVVDQSFQDIEKVTIKAGDNADVIFYDVDASTLSGSASFSFDGGGGRDAFSFSGVRNGYDVNLLPGNQYRITDIDSVDGNRGTLVVSSVERLIFEDKEINLRYYAQSVQGDGGNNALSGSIADDAIFGFAGDDVLIGSIGDDFFDGGIGTDTASFARSDKGVVINLAVNDAQFTNEGRDTFKSIENLIGSAFADGLRGDEGANILDGLLGNDNLFGFGGADTLIGGDGADRIDGGDGADILRGGLGRDILTGGADADRFVFDTLAATPQPDTIRDFISGTDEIALSKSVFAALSGSTLATSAFHTGARATTADQHIIYNSATGALFYDADGLGGLAQIQIAQLNARPMIDANDFVLI